MRAPDTDAPTRKTLCIERVKRAAEGEHHVVGDVDDVRDRAHTGGNDSRFQPRRRWADRDLAEEPPDVARATLEVVDLDEYLLVGPSWRIGARRRRKLELEERGDLPGESVDRQEIGTVPRHLDLEHVVPDRDHVPKRRPWVPGLG